MGKQIEMDWTECDLVERVPGRCGGRPTIKGTRIEPGTIITDMDMGSSTSEIHASFPSLPISTIEGILAFASKHQPVS